MADIEERIFDALTTEVSTELGATFQAMRRVFNPGLHDTRSAEKSFGVLPGAVSDDTENGVLKNYTVDQTFEIKIMDTYARDDDDSQKLDIVHDLSDKIDELIKRLMNQRLGVSEVLIISNPNVSAPEELPEARSILLILSIDVKYRSQVD